MMYLKRFHIGSYELGMFALVIAASLLRFTLIRFNWPITNSDEATMDLMALHIASLGEHPIFFYGQNYMGPLEAYIGSILFLYFDTSVFTLRIGLILLFALWLICLYYLTSLLYTKRLALATVGLLSLGSSEMIVHQLKAIGGYPEIVAFGTLIFLLAVRLALSSQAAQAKTSRETQRQRWLVYGLLGFLTGLALWTDQLILPSIVATGLLIFLFCRQELRTQAGLRLLLGIILGASPLIAYNLTAPFGHSSINILLDLHRSGIDEMTTKHIPFVQQIVGALLIALPTATGANPLCSVEQIPFFGPSTAQTLPCTIWQGGWALGYLILWCVAAWFAGSMAWKLWRQTVPQARSHEERRALIIQFSRLMLLASAGMTLVLYALSPAAALVPATSSRYLICMLIATPAVLWPLWKNLARLKLPTSKSTKALLIVKGAMILFIATTFLVGTIQIFSDIPNAQRAYDQQNALIQDLLHIGATRIYSEYWTCNRLIFQSDEQIICSVLDPSLKPGLDRYSPYHDLVRTAPHFTYVFPLDSAQAVTFEHTVHSRNLAYQRYKFDGYIIYQTSTSVGTQ